MFRNLNFSLSRIGWYIVVWFFIWPNKILSVKLLNKFFLQSRGLYFVSLASVLCTLAKTEVPACGGNSEGVICHDIYGRLSQKFATSLLIASKDSCLVHLWNKVLSPLCSYVCKSLGAEQLKNFWVSQFTEALQDLGVCWLQASK